MVKKLLQKYLVEEKLDYKVILTLLILKKISDQWKAEYAQALKESLGDGLSAKDADKEAKKDSYHEINFKKELLWDTVREGGGKITVTKLLEYISTATKYLSENNEQFQHLPELFNPASFSESTEEKAKISGFFEDLSDNTKYDLAQVDYDKIMDYFIIEFSLKDAKKGGIYTPREIIMLIYGILGPNQHAILYDPSSSYGEFMLEAFRLRKQLAVFGQEGKQEQYLISQVNFALHQFLDFKLEKQSSLLYPFKEHGTFKRFDFVVSNPEWNQVNCHEEALRKGEFVNERFFTGTFPYKDRGDWSWIQHMIASTKETGRTAVVIDGGALFRGSGARSDDEKTIRAKIIEMDYLETVIQLPEKLFYSNKGGAGVILIFNKSKPPKRKGKILVVNAIELSEQHPEFKSKRILTPKAIDKIVDVVKSFKAVPHFSAKVEKTIVASKDFDYNLNPSLYAYPEEKLEKIDVEKELVQLKEIDKVLAEINPLIYRISKLFEQVD